ncbi:MAG TPA: hypothetical protein VGQ37_09280 [Vicinamibacterales bacterium]|nr:hypothetical protein [Vicinamibacterales bacterium]
MRLLAVALTAGLAAACGGSTASAPSPTPTPAPVPTGLNGAWMGTITHPDVGTGSLRVVLDLAPLGSYLGTWQTNFANPEYSRSGRASATVQGSLVTLLISDDDFASPPATSPSRPECFWDHSVFIVFPFDTSRLDGEARFGLCEARPGPVSLRRQ